MKPAYSEFKLPPNSTRQSVDDEERKALISPEGRRSEDVHYDEEENAELQPPTRSRKCLVFSVLFFSFLLLSIAIPIRRFFSGPSVAGTKPQLKTQGLLSNGTHDFKKTAIIVSIDGLRYVLHIVLCDVT